MSRLDQHLSANEGHATHAMQFTSGARLAPGPFAVQDALRQIVDAGPDAGVLLQAVTEIILEHTTAEYVAACDVQDGGRPTITELASRLEVVPHALPSDCLVLASEACAAGQAIVRAPSASATWQLAAIPVPRRSAECLLVLYTPSGTFPDQTLSVLQLVTAHIATWDVTKQHEETIFESRQIAALTDLVSRVESTSDTEQACKLLVNEVCAHLQVDQVAAGLCKRDSTCRVVAISGQSGFNPDSEPVRLAEAVLQETVARESLSIWPASEDDRYGLLTFRQYCQATGAQVIISIPLRDEVGHVQGAWFVTGNVSLADRGDVISFLTASERPLGSALQLLERARQNKWLRAVRAAADAVRADKGRTLLATTGAVLLLTLIPVRYQVKSTCELQPTTRRFVAAPFDGRLENTAVEPGEIVAADQLLATMDGHEIHWELSGAKADLHRAAKERAGHVSTHESGKAQLLQHEIDSLQSQTELLEHRAANLEIRSPIAGMVVTGDLKKAEGMPLEVGQTLFEIAPLEKMVVELAIPEDDVRFVQPGMPARIWLDAFPMRSWEAVVQRIHPRAELKDHENVFIAEVRLDNQDGDLRPGMRGRAKTSTRKLPLGWNLFHRPTAAIWEWLGW